MVAGADYATLRAEIHRVFPLSVKNYRVCEKTLKEMIDANKIEKCQTNRFRVLIITDTASAAPAAAALASGSATKSPFVASDKVHGLKVVDNNALCGSSGIKVGNTVSNDRETTSVVLNPVLE